MKPVKFLQKMSVALATVGLLVPHVGTAVGAESQTLTKQSATPASVKIIDVSLTNGGVLQGQVVNGQGVVQANTSVVVQQGKDTVATATTNKDGEFAVQGLKGGVYVVSSNGAAGVVRAWAPETAPPSAVKGVLLVPGEQIDRAQLNGFVNRWGVGAVVVAVIIGTIIAVSIDHSSGS